MRVALHVLKMNKGMFLLLMVTGMQTPVKAQTNKDTTSLVYAFSKGHMTGHMRNVLMFTNNASGLSDYGADAIGGHIVYQTRAFHNFRFMAGTHFTFPVFSYNMVQADPATGALNRYESTLFDVTRPGERKNFVLLSLLNITYQLRNGKISFGKQLLNTPFINVQDNRMQPTAVEGLYADIHHKQWRLETGWLYNIAPRGTMQWFSVAGSLGRYPQGTNANGSKGNYQGNIQSKGVGLLGIHWQPDKCLHLQLWDQYADNLFNTALFQAEYKIPAGNNSKWLAELQYIQQDVLNKGGNADPAKTYFNKGNQVNIISSRAGWENKRIRLLLNYTSIMAGGRFTMPREWGTEPFYTFLSRERSEGVGNLKAISASVKWEFPKQHLTAEVGYGRYYLPDVKQYALNKYGVPSYDHSKVGVEYSFGGVLTNMKVSALYVYKGKKGNDYDNARYVINKVDLSHFALVANYLF
jgi:hypothetical protein